MLRWSAVIVARHVNVAAEVDTSDRAKLPQDAVDYFPMKMPSIVEKPANRSDMLRMICIVQIQPRNMS